MKIAYIRTAIDEEDKQVKLEALEKLGYDKLYVEKEVTDRETLVELEKVAAGARQGDVLCVNTLTDLGRSLDEIVRFSKQLMGKGISVFSLADNAEKSEGENDFNLGLLSTMSERQRKSLVRRLKAGRTAAAAKGMKVGRKKGLTPAYQEIAPAVYQMSQEKGVTIKTIREKFNIGSRNTYYKIVEFQKKALMAEKNSSLAGQRERHAPTLKLFYLDLETTGPSPILNSINQLALIIEVNGDVKLRNLLLIRPREISDLPLDYVSPGTGVTRAQLANEKEYRPAAEALNELCEILGRFIDPDNPADCFFIVGYGTEEAKIPFLRELFNEGSLRYEDYFHTGSMDVKVLATQHLWTRRGEFSDFSLREVYQALGGNRSAKKGSSGDDQQGPSTGVEIGRQVYKHITSNNIL